MKKVAVGIVLRNGLVLACQRQAGSHFPLKWEFPGGKVEDGETFEDALVRELEEELSIKAEIEREFFHQEWTYRDGNRENTFDVRYFLVRTFSGTPVNNAFEHIRWVSPAALKSMDNLEGNRPAIEHLIRFTTASERGKNHDSSEQAA